MKKLFILALAAMFCMAGFAKSTQEVINEILISATLLSSHDTTFFLRFS